MRIKEVCIRENIDPFHVQVMNLKTRIRVPKDTDPELLAKILADYRQDYELVMPDTSNGEHNDSWYFQPRLRLRVQIASDLTKYCYAQMKAVETKTETDMTVKVIMKQFSVEAPKEVIVESQKVVALPEVVDVVVDKIAEEQGGA